MHQCTLVKMFWSSESWKFSSVVIDKTGFRSSPQLGDCTSPNTPQILKQGALAQNTTHTAGWGTASFKALGSLLSTGKPVEASNPRCPPVPPRWRSHGRKSNTLSQQKASEMHNWKGEASASTATSSSLCCSNAPMWLVVSLLPSDVWTVKGKQAPGKRDRWIHELPRWALW